jgi:hypothetical protein
VEARKFTPKIFLKRTARVIVTYLNPAMPSDKVTALEGLKALRERAAIEYPKLSLLQARKQFVERFNAVLSTATGANVEPLVFDEPEPEAPPVETPTITGPLFDPTVEGLKKGDFVYDKEKEVFGRIIVLMDRADPTCASVCLQDRRGRWQNSTNVPRTRLEKITEVKDLIMIQGSWYSEPKKPLPLQV